MIAFGSVCNIGDQLHPSGLMDMQTYKNVGKAFEYVEQIEEYGPGGVPVANLGLWFTGNTEADMGVCKILLELQMDFLGANEHNLAGFQTVIIPSEPCLNAAQVGAIEQYLADGGSLVVWLQERWIRAGHASCWTSVRTSRARRCTISTTRRLIRVWEMT